LFARIADGRKILKDDTDQPLSETLSEPFEHTITKWP
jgi:hypothetical protein